MEELIWVAAFYSQPRLQRWDGLYIAQSRVEAGRIERATEREVGEQEIVGGGCTVPHLNSASG